MNIHSPFIVPNKKGITSDNLLYMFIVAIAIQMMLAIGQTSAADLNPGSPNFFNPENSLLCQFDAANCQSNITPDTAGFGNRIPSTQSSVSATTGNTFTDATTFLIGWVFGALALVVNFLSVPFTVVSLLGLPSYVAGFIGLMWYGVLFLLFISYFGGR